MGATLALLCGAGLGARPAHVRGRSRRTGTRQRPSAQAYQADPFWPKPLPNNWILGSVTGVAVDSKEHVWIVHRGLDSLTARTEAGPCADSSGIGDLLRAGAAGAALRPGRQSRRALGRRRTGI